MKKSLFLFYVAATISLLVFSAYSGEETDFPGGSPPGYTGSPGDGKDCTFCHGGSVAPVIGWITSNIWPEGYLPGETYDITVTLNGSGRKGFLVSPQDGSGNIYGQLIAGQGSKLAGTGYITHNSSTTSNPATWSFQWTAPEAGSGTVTLYGAFTLGEPVTKLSSLTVHENTSTNISELRKGKVALFPVPANGKLNIRSSETIISLQILDQGGRLIFSPEDFSSNNIDVSHLSAGVYLVRINTGRHTFVERIIIN